LTPETEQELTDISRGYEESKTNYNSLLQKQMQSQLATSLEQRQKGEQFRIVDPPSLPKKPSAPNHLRLVSLAWVGSRFGTWDSCLARTHGCSDPKGKRSCRDCSSQRAGWHSPFEHAGREPFSYSQMADGAWRSGGISRFDCPWEPLRIIKG